MRRRKRVFEQERSERTYQAILRAAAKVFPKLGYDKAQTPDIAKAAGVSTGALYRYFTDKREIFLEMLEDELSVARAEVAERLRPENFAQADPNSVIRQVIDVLFERAKKDRALTRVYFAMALTDPDVAELRAKTQAEDRAVLAPLLAAALPSDRVRHPEAAAFVLQIATIAIAAECSLVRTRRPDESHVREELTRAFQRYLLGS